MKSGKNYTSTYPDFDNREFDFFNEYNIQQKKKNEISFCLAYIQDKLQHQSISAIVGAGFSKNANSFFPDWATLLTDAYLEMNPLEGIEKGKEKDESYRKKIAETIHRKGEPKIASEYEKFKGMRESLDLYIEKHISKIQNGELNLDIHQDFLNLNWCDVITTNWDCLLEKANAKMNQYKLVTNAKDLRISNKKRIIKIHGTIRESPSEENYKYDGCFDHIYIITEKDYSTYHTNHEGFSNFMKVKMLENSFCLFGFSGTDWNFRFWIKELKRMMTKGGETKNLNPIFLFDITSQEYGADEELFFKNNYIIPLKIDDVLSCINDNSNLSPEISRNHSIQEKFSLIFKYFSPQKDTKLPRFNNKEKLHSAILRNFQNKNDKNSLKILIVKHPTFPTFSFFNLAYTRLITRKLLPFYHQLNSWTENDYVFLYSWCLSNFFSLSQLFKKSQIELIIKQYIEKKYYLNKAQIFSDIIFKHFVDLGDEKSIDSFAKTTHLQNSDLLNFHKCKLYTKQLEYKKLKNILANWQIETKANIDPRFLLCKINALTVFENGRFESNYSVQIKKLFEIALRTSKNIKFTQIHIFVLLYYKSYMQRSWQEIPKNIQLELDNLQDRKYNHPHNFIEFINSKQKKEAVKPNSKIRYQNTNTIPIDNFEELSSKRILNFFDYTCLPMSGFLPENEFINLLKECKTLPDISFHLYSQAIPYCGHDSDEDFLKSAVPLILRNLNSNQQRYISHKSFEIFKYKIENNEDPRVFCYIMDEIVKRSSKAFRKEHFDYFYDHFFRHSKLSYSLEKIADKGRVWGIFPPFINFLSDLDDNKKQKKFLDWTINRKISKGSDAFSGYSSYFDTLILNSKDKSFLKEYFHSPKLIKKITDSIDKSLFFLLDAYDFLDSKTQKFTRDYLSQNMALNISPYFVKTCFSPKLKSRLLDLIINKNHKTESAADWPLCDYIEILHKIKRLEAKELNQICLSLKNRFQQQINDKHDEFNSLFEWDLNRYFEVLQKAATDLQAERIGAIKECLDLLHPVYISNAKEILQYDWLNTTDNQAFRNNFYKSFSFAKFLHQENSHIRYTGLVLSKILTQENPIFEAALQIFIYKCQDNFWREQLTRDDTIIFYVKSIIEKFQKEIPLCYDDLFIKEKIEDLKKIFKLQIHHSIKNFPFRKNSL